MEDTYLSRPELKQIVKSLFNGNWGKAVLLYLPVLIFLFSAQIVNLISGVIYSTAHDNGTLLSILPVYYLLNIVVIILIFFIVPISIGSILTTLDWIRTRKAPDSPFSAAFMVFNSGHFWGYMGISFLVGIFTILWSFLFVVPGVVKAYSYSQAIYLYHDAITANPDQKIKFRDCIAKSQQLMSGNKARLFILDLSFMGWYLLSIFTFYIGFLWCIPYFSGTRIAFYQDLVSQPTPTQIND